MVTRRLQRAAESDEGVVGCETPDHLQLGDLLCMAAERSTNVCRFDSWPVDKVGKVGPCPLLVFHIYKLEQNRLLSTGHSMYLKFVDPKALTLTVRIHCHALTVAKVDQETSLSEQATRQIKGEGCIETPVTPKTFTRHSNLQLFKI